MIVPSKEVFTMQIYGLGSSFQRRALSGVCMRVCVYTQTVLVYTK